MAPTCFEVRGTDEGASMDRDTASNGGKWNTPCIRPTGFRNHAPIWRDNAAHRDPDRSGWASGRNTVELWRRGWLTRSDESDVAERRRYCDRNPNFRESASWRRIHL